MPLWQSFSPVDVLVVGAVNDVLRGKNATKIIRDIGNFKNDVPFNEDPFRSWR